MSSEYPGRPQQAPVPPSFNEAFVWDVNAVAANEARPVYNTQLFTPEDIAVATVATAELFRAQGRTAPRGMHYPKRQTTIDRIEGQPVRELSLADMIILAAQLEGKAVPRWRSPYDASPRRIVSLGRAIVGATYGHNHARYDEGNASLLWSLVYGMGSTWGMSEAVLDTVSKRALEVPLHSDVPPVFAHFSSEHRSLDDPRRSPGSHRAIAANLMVNLGLVAAEKPAAPPRIAVPKEAYTTREDGLTEQAVTRWGVSAAQYDFLARQGYDRISYVFQTALEQLRRDPKDLQARVHLARAWAVAAERIAAGNPENHTSQAGVVKAQREATTFGKLLSHSRDAAEPHLQAHVLQEIPGIAGRTAGYETVRLLADMLHPGLSDFALHPSRVTKEATDDLVGQIYRLYNIKRAPNDPPQLHRALIEIFISTMMTRAVTNGDVPRQSALASTRAARRDSTLRAPQIRPWLSRLSKL